MSAIAGSISREICIGVGFVIELMSMGWVGMNLNCPRLA